jgi:CHRD domain
MHGLEAPTKLDVRQETVSEHHVHVTQVVASADGWSWLLRSQIAAEYTLRVNSGVLVTQAHLHCAPAGVNGPVIVFLAGFRPEGWDVDGRWISNATITDANVILTTTLCGATLAQVFKAARDGNVYVNVHSVANPAGVVRGQLEPDDDDD